MHIRAFRTSIMLIGVTGFITIGSACPSDLRPASIATANDVRGTPIPTRLTAPSETTPSAPISAEEFLGSVAKKYDSFESFRSDGVNIHTLTYEGKETSRNEIPFSIEYSRGKRAQINWNDDEKSNEFHFEGSKSWLKINGTVEEEFSDFADGLMMISLGNGSSLFEVGSFIFRKDLSANPPLLNAVQTPKIIGEGEVQGRSCYLVGGPLKVVEGSLTYWIDKKDLVLWRVEKEVVHRKQVEQKEYIGKSHSVETYSNIQAK